MCEITHLHSTRRVFNSRRGHLRINTKSIKTPAGWRTPLGEITPLPRPGSSPLKTPPRSQHFGLPASALIGAKAADGPQVTVEPWPLRALLRHCLYAIKSRGIKFYDTRCYFNMRSKAQPNLPHGTKARKWKTVKGKNKKKRICSEVSVNSPENPRIQLIVVNNNNNKTTTYIAP